MKTELKGFLAVLGAAFLWGFSGTVAKLMFHNSISPYLLVQVRMLWAAVILLVYLAIFNRKALKIDKNDLLYFTMLGIPVLALLQFTYLYTISQTNVGTAVFLQYFAPIFIMLYVLLRKQESWSGIKVSALGLAFIGCFLILFGGAGLKLSVNITGLISGFASAILYGAYAIYSKRGLNKYSSITVMTYAMVLGACFWNLLVPVMLEVAHIFSVVEGWKMFFPWEVFLQDYKWDTYAFFLYIAVFSAILPYGLFTKGVQLIMPSTASIIALTEPVFATVVAFLILGEKMTMLQFSGGMIVLVAVGLLQYFEARLNIEITSSNEQM